MGISFEYLVEVKGSGRIKALVNEVGQYKEVVGFDCPSVWKCLRWCPHVFVHLESWLKVALKSRTGSSLQAILKYIVGDCKVEAAKVAVRVCPALERGPVKGTLKSARATGEGLALWKSSRLGSQRR